jgi:hypothetical protein
MPGKAKSKKRGKSQNEKMKREPVTPTADPADVNPFEETESLDNNKIFIECPGATVYDPQTREVIAGVVFVDEADPSRGYRIVNHLVFAPGHKKRRLINKKHRRRIRRCQACQDLTVRLIRREGPDFFIPNPRFPRKRQLKPVEKTW